MIRRTLICLWALLCLFFWSQGTWAQSVPQHPSEVEASFSFTAITGAGFSNPDYAFGGEISVQLNKRFAFELDGLVSTANKTYLGNGTNLALRPEIKFYLNNSVYFDVGTKFKDTFTSQYHRLDFSPTLGLGYDNGKLKVCGEYSFADTSQYSQQGITLSLKYRQSISKFGYYVAFGPNASFVRYQQFPNQHRNASSIGVTVSIGKTLGPS